MFISFHGIARCYLNVTQKKPTLFHRSQSLGFFIYGLEIVKDKDHCGNKILFELINFRYI